MRRVPHGDAPGLGDLVGDVSVFTGEVVFRRLLATRVAKVERFADVEVLWNDLLRRGTRQPLFRVVRGGTTVPGREVARRAGIGNQNLDDLVSANDVIDRYRRGDTVVLQGLHHTNPHLARLANNLALALDHPVQVNAYLSPAGARGLDLHFDFHDVFVVQLGGSKRWRVWAPLARTTNPVKDQRSIRSPQFDELGEPLLDVELGAGDCLYLPRGYPHAAETVDQQSEHLTIGLLAVTWHRILRKAIDAEVAMGRLTGALPVGMLEPGFPSPVETLDVTGLREVVTPDALRHWTAKEIWRRQPATRLRPRVVPRLESRPLAFAAGPLLWLTTVRQRAVLGLGDRILDMPVEAHGFLSGLLDADCPFATTRLTGLDDESRDVVLRRLLAEGVLFHVD